MKDAHLQIKCALFSSVKAFFKSLLILRVVASLFCRLDGSSMWDWQMRNSSENSTEFMLFPV